MKMWLGTKATGRNMSASPTKKFPDLFLLTTNRETNPIDLEATAKLMDWGKDDWSCIEDFELDEEQLKEIRPMPAGRSQQN